MKFSWAIKIFLIMFISTSSFAASYQGKITSVFAYNSKIFILIKNGGFDNSESCTNQADGMSLWLDPTQDYDKAMFSLALTAKTTDKLVWVGGGDCIAGPFGQSAKLVAIDFKG
ncbi:hypothetical protein P886_1759 [Alteromonadaceae bacterium 2753L.S.0a.02]|nr:hypothetical protein P886_1759 [Alteromonadaceae bacterium 2753L.S.0a.02]